jgi:hypothetical protein
LKALAQGKLSLTTNIAHGFISLTQKFSLTTKLYNNLYSFSFCYAFFILTLGPQSQIVFLATNQIPEKTLQGKVILG